MKINGIVLAAGYGTRLRPLTDHLPKPALPLCGTPMLIRALTRLFDAGCSRIAVNTHHLGGIIEKTVKESRFADRVKIYPEKEILGTAGPLVNAKDLLSDCDHFILHNGDVVCDFDLKRMLREHAESGASLTMALVEGSENRVLVKGRSVIDILGKTGAPESSDTRKMTYACVSVFSKDFFECLPESPVPYSFSDAWANALRSGKKINAFFPDAGYFWSDIGSFEQYFAAHEKIMLHGMAPSFGCGQKIIKGRNTTISASADLSGFTAAGSACSIGEGACLKDCILLDGASVTSGYRAHEIIGGDFSCHRDFASLSASDAMAGVTEIHSLPEQGSDRRFYRAVRKHGDGAVLMVSNARDADFDRFTDFGKFFSEHGLFTPELYACDRDRFMVLMEDLGDSRLYDKAVHADGETLFSLYEKTIGTLAVFQVKGGKAVESAGHPVRVFGHADLRWETDYFRDRFLRGLCGLDIGSSLNDALSEEFDRLAEMTERLPYNLMHRDFQSQNIMCKGGNNDIRFVDFQGARLGPYAYDAASLIKDPYMMLSKELRTRLYSAYRLKLESAGFAVSGNFERDCLLCALQRNMQALGAYGFLSLVKGKMRYLDYAEGCLSLLAEGVNDINAILEKEERFTALLNICGTAGDVLPRRIQKIKDERMPS